MAAIGSFRWFVRCGASVVAVAVGLAACSSGSSGPWESSHEDEICKKVLHVRFTTVGGGVDPEDAAVLREYADRVDDARLAAQLRVLAESDSGKSPVAFCEVEGSAAGASVPGTTVHPSLDDGVISAGEEVPPELEDQYEEDLLREIGREEIAEARRVFIEACSDEESGAPADACGCVFDYLDEQYDYALDPEIDHLPSGAMDEATTECV